MFIFFLEVYRQANPNEYLIMGMFLLVDNKRGNIIHTHTHTKIQRDKKMMQ